MIIPRSILTLIFILFISFLQISCKKEKGRHYTIDEDFKKWTLFQPGSYWIYKEDSLNLIDSAYIRSLPLLHSTVLSWNDNNTTNTIDEITIPITSQLIKGWWLDAAPEFQSRLYFTLPDTTFAVALVYNIPYNTLYNVSIPGPAFYESVKYYSTFILNSILYNDVIQTNLYYDENVFNFYFSKNVGLIKVAGKWKAVKHSWSLIRHHIVQ